MKWYLKVLKQYADFKGRARRKELWMFILFNIIFSIIAVFLDSLFGTADPMTGYETITYLYYLAVLIPSLAVGARRLHDIGKTGWLLLVGLIPIIGTIWLLILYVREGDSNENRFGPNPKNATP